MLNCCITRIVFYYFVDTQVTGSFASALYCVLNGINSLLFLMKRTRQQYMYLYNTTIAVQFQPSQQKCSLLEGIPNHVIIILQFHNIIRVII